MNLTLLIPHTRHAFVQLTSNLPMAEWYFPTADNDLQYWGLDYPPLTAFHSYLCGVIGTMINPEWMALHESRGVETLELKMFMRATVLVADILVLVPAILLWVRFCQRNLWSSAEWTLALLMLLSPGFILIDHGHFQFNGISLGLALLGATMICSGSDLVGSVFFVAALNYKQMELYHALPFFFMLLGKCFKQPTLLAGVSKLAMIGVTVAAAFVLCWAPFLTSADSVSQGTAACFENFGLAADFNFWNRDCAGYFPEFSGVSFSIHKVVVILLISSECSVCGFDRAQIYQAAYLPCMVGCSNMCVFVPYKASSSN